MRYGQSLASYLPSTVVTELERPERGGRGGGGPIAQTDLPIRQELPGGAVCAFFDISGYTLLNERMNAVHRGRGAEHVAVSQPPSPPTAGIITPNFAESRTALSWWPPRLFSTSHFLLPPF